MPTITNVLPHMRISWGGSLGTPGVEVWTNSLAWMATVGSDLDAILGLGLAGETANIVGLATAVSNWFGTPLAIGANQATGKGSGCSPTAKLEWVKLNYINDVNHYALPSCTYFLPTPTPGGGFTGIVAQDMPWQCSTAITLRTTNPRGRGSHGRIFPPMSGISPDPGSPYSAEIVTHMMTNAFTGLIDNINSGLYMGASGYDSAGAAEHHPGNVCVVSVAPKSGPNIGKPALLTPVYSVEVDRVVDVQRSRVNKVARMTSGAQLVTLNTT